MPIALIVPPWITPSLISLQYVASVTTIGCECFFHLSHVALSHPYTYCSSSVLPHIEVFRLISQTLLSLSCHHAILPEWLKIVLSISPFASGATRNAIAPTLSTPLPSPAQYFFVCYLINLFIIPTAITSLETSGPSMYKCQTLDCLHPIHFFSSYYSANIVWPLLPLHFGIQSLLLFLEHGRH